ncbi:uncharacterized protein [Chelonus insularis]|uniref:uncharacterized protein n=1 Tax=Chelonus insularis TaxID=460826 RepID=UPI00158C6B6F|nr:uncharacterized protein LOC118064449 [Chelonus insularis]
MMLKLFIFIALCVSLTITQDISLPTSVKTCKRNSDDYSSCLRLAIQESWPLFVQGIPALNMPPLDPLSTDFMMNDFNFDGVSGKFVVRNAKSYGLARTRFLSVRPAHAGARFKLEIDMEIPTIFVEGGFKSDGKVGSFNVVATKGHFNISMEDLRATLKLEGPVVNDRWEVQTFSFMPEVGKMKIWASDLFNGNEELNKAALTFINEFWKVLYEGMLPTVSKTWNNYWRDFVNEYIFSKISFSKTFP